ncbi:DUF4286 family protein [Rapidithrix thailandica]|uniref:DUF4286 family protein n=1 Tax=Rapidithrix thailandica TaxID=413964 RepID=A0AAW9S2S5_9BACT
MIVYNVTVNVEHEATEEWINFMKNEHIPEVMATGCFSEYKLLRLTQEVADHAGITFAVQYWCESLSILNEYIAKYAPVLQEKHTKKFQNKFVAFRTILEEI